jgi:hypothetical protein
MRTQPLAFQLAEVKLEFRAKTATESATLQ